ncbi:MAG: transcription termination factor Rho [Planctomycetia bacterium]|nr:transcription termination factor Rho [Planctomycetia bacterium]
MGARGRRGEPITLAEELSLERQNRNRHPGATDSASAAQTPESEEKQMFINQLGELSTDELIALARQENMDLVDGESRQDLIFRILKQRIRNGGLMFGEGTLEILPDEFGFLRSPDYHYLSCPDDIYISPSQIRRFGLRNGLTISGQIRPPKERERYFALLRVEAINHEAPSQLATKIPFDDLVAMHPCNRIVLEHDPNELSSRIIDLTVPIGFGQRGLIVSPPRAGKTILLQKIAKAVLTNYPESYVFMLLIDERPEEVTDMEREIKGDHCEVVSSTFDEPALRHIQVSEMVLEKAKRMVEYGKDVVIFLDSITRLARAWNAECPDSGKTLSGGVDAAAMTRPKKFFGSARKIENGGSLTIIATALVDTGSQMDEVIFEEFKGTGNLEIKLDRALVDKRLWPSIDIVESGTRREEMILDPEEHERMSAFRRQQLELNPVDAMEDLIAQLGKYKNNAEFLMSLKLN